MKVINTVCVLVLTLICYMNAWSVPIEQTQYGKSGLRFEGRTATPATYKDDALRQSYELPLAKAGVQSRWIQVVDNYGAPLIKNPFLPCTDPNADENEVIIRKWVADLHKSGTAVLSWYPLSFCHSGWEQHPEWRQQFIVPYTEPGFACCFNTGYGDALINYCNYVIEKFDLDGIWFDGSAWTPIWSKPVPLSCNCDACKAKFNAATGKNIPDKLDWSDPVIRQWANWRYEEFGGFIGKLAASIREHKPTATVVINHYHRPGIPWVSAIPLNPYSADIISGSEASEPETLDLTMRLCRAYGRMQSEVWRPFDLASTAEASADPLLRHALICYAAGGHPVYGGDIANPLVASTAALISPIIDSINPYADGQSVPYTAVHVSQQTETFYCERGGIGYFTSLGIWTKALGEAHMPPDYIYDKDFIPAKIATYKALFLPLSIAMSDTQSKTVINYVKNGGTVLCGIAAGQLDQEAQLKSKNLLGAAFGYNFQRAPLDDGLDACTLKINLADGRTLSATGMRVPMTLAGKGWKVLARSSNKPVAAIRSYGKGRVVVLSIDPGNLIGSMPAAAGNTKLGISDKQAQSGKHSLEYIDDPVAPMTFYPDLENYFSIFAAPDYTGGEFDCDLRLGKDAEVTIDLRSQVAPVEGPHIVLQGGGKATTIGAVLGDIPVDNWIHLKVKYTFATAGQEAFADVIITLPDGQKYTGRGQCTNSGYKSTNWMVIYGSGTKVAQFYVDNVKLLGTKADGTTKTVMDMDFENTDNLTEPPTTFIASLISAAKQGVSAPVNVITPGYVRTGIYTKQKNQVLVHLYNSKGLTTDWLRKSGPPVTLDCSFPIKSARLALQNKSLPVSKTGKKWQIKLPPIGLYQIVEIQR